MKYLFLLALVGGCQSYSTTWNVVFNPGIELGVCREGLQWSSQNVQPDSSGHFDETWAPNEPDTARVVGDVTEASFNATLSCLPDETPSGTLTATAVDDGYDGSYAFDGQAGAITVRAVE